MRAEARRVIEAASSATGCQKGRSRWLPNQRCRGSGAGICRRIGARSPGWMCSPSWRQSSPTTTTAASQAAASRAAAAGSVPSLWCTRSWGAAARIPARGVTTTPGSGRVSEEPRSPRFAPAARAPITASEPRSGSGSSASAFLSNTIALVAASRARLQWAAQPRREAGYAPAGTANWARSRRSTASSRRSSGRVPAARASARQPSKIIGKGISKSSPARSAARPSRKPKMKSLTTKPPKPQRFLRMVVSSSWFWAHHWPFTLL